MQDLLKGSAIDCTYSSLLPPFPPVPLLLRRMSPTEPDLSSAPTLFLVLSMPCFFDSFVPYLATGSTLSARAPSFFIWTHRRPTIDFSHEGVSSTVASLQAGVAGIAYPANPAHQRITAS